MEKESSLTVRKKDYKFNNDITRYWLLNSPFATHFANTLHAIFPVAEKFFVKIVNEVLPQISDKKIREDAKHFSAQEMQHSLQHKKFHKVLKSQGYNVDFLEKMTGGLMDLAQDKFPQKLNISMVAGYEHYTAVFAKIALETDLLACCPKELKELFEWHAAEEIEHKAVAYDILNAIDDNYLLRVLGMLGSTTILGGIMTIGIFNFLREDRKLLDIETFIQSFQVFWGDKQLAPKMIKAFAEYFEPNFHPNQVNDSHLAKNIFEKHAKAAEA